MPSGRKPQGKRALSNAERQARYRASQPAQPTPVKTQWHRSTNRRNCPERWRGAVIEWLALKAEYADWFRALPDSLRDSSTADALAPVIDLDLTTRADTPLPRGYGRNGSAKASCRKK